MCVCGSYRIPFSVDISYEIIFVSRPATQQIFVAGTRPRQIHGAGVRRRRHQPVKRAVEHPHLLKLRQGLLVHKYNPVPQDNGITIYKEQVHLTPKGLAKLAELLGRKLMP